MHDVIVLFDHLVGSLVFLLLVLTVASIPLCIITEAFDNKKEKTLPGPSSLKKLIQRFFSSGKNLIEDKNKSVQRGGRYFDFDRKMMCPDCLSHSVWVAKEGNPQVYCAMCDIEWYDYREFSQAFGKGVK